MPNKPARNFHEDKRTGLAYATGADDPYTRWDEMAPGLWFPSDITVLGPAPGLPRVVDEDDGVEMAPFGIMALFRLDPYGVGYEMSSLKIDASAVGHGGNPARLVGGEVDGSVLRKLSLVGLKDGIGEAFGSSRVDIPEGDFVGTALKIDEENADEHLILVARVYVREALSGRRPAKAVSEYFGVATSTAGYWIRRAKDLGYIRRERPRGPAS